MKTVKDLIEYLKTKPEDMPIEIVYDSFESDMYVFEAYGRLAFSNENYLPVTIGDPVVEFESETEKRDLDEYTKLVEKNGNSSFNIMDLSLSSILKESYEDDDDCFIKD